MYLTRIGIKQSLANFTSFDDAFAYKRAILSGMGIGVFLDFFIQDEIKKGSLSDLNSPYSFRYNRLNINMLFHKNVSLSPHQTQFKDFIKAYFQSQPWLPLPY